MKTLLLQLMICSLISLADSATSPSSSPRTAGTAAGLSSVSNAQSSLSNVRRVNNIARQDEVISSTQMDILISISELFEMDITKMTLENGNHKDSWQINPIKYFTQVHLFLENTETSTGV